MKVCKDNSKRFQALKRGDVFRWRSGVRSDDIAMKRDIGYVWVGMQDPGITVTSTCETSEVIFYPNACIILGDPE